MINEELSNFFNSHQYVLVIKEELRNKPALAKVKGCYFSKIKLDSNFGSQSKRRYPDWVLQSD